MGTSNNSFALYCKIFEMSYLLFKWDITKLQCPFMSVITFIKFLLAFSPMCHSAAIIHSCRKLDYLGSFVVTQQVDLQNLCWSLTQTDSVFTGIMSICQKQFPNMMFKLTISVFEYWRQPCSLVTFWYKWRCYANSKTQKWHKLRVNVDKLVLVYIKCNRNTWDLYL